MMDRREHLMDAIGEVGSDLIFEAETKRFAPGPLRRWGSLAAALVLVAGLTALVLPWFQTGDTTHEAASSQTAAEEAPVEEEPTPTEEVQAETTIEAETETETELDLATDSVESEDEPSATGPEQYASWTLNLPSYDDAKELWTGNRSQQLLTNFVTTLEAGCPDPWDDMLNFSDGRELDDLDLLRFFRLVLSQQKGNGWYSGPNYEERWFEAQEDLPEDSPYAAVGGWYDVPVSEIRSVLSYWLTGYDLDPAALGNMIVEENTVRFSTLLPMEQEVHLLLEDAVFDDETQSMTLLVARYSDASLSVVDAVREYTLYFEGGLVRYQSIQTQ